MHTFYRFPAAVLLSAAMLTAQLGALAPAVSAADQPAQELISEDALRFRTGTLGVLSQSALDLAELSHNARFEDCLMLDCIDVSHHQGEIDWQAVAASGINCAIIRLGFRGYGQTGNIAEDSNFRQNLQGAYEAGLQVGVYFYTQAINTEEALEEADYVLNKLGSMSQYEITCPVFIDIENTETADGSVGRMDAMELSSRELTDNVKAFCSVIEAGGYRAGVYANKFWLENKLITSELENDYEIWLANYTTETYYQGNYSCWQYSKAGWVPGINEYVDRSVMYSRPVSYEADGMRLDYIGESGRPVITGDGTLYYVTSDPDVVTVSYDGTITAVAEGSAQVMAISSNGTKDIIDVTVVPADVSITKTATLLLTEPGALESLEYIAPSDFSVISGSNDVVNVNEEGQIEAIDYGTAEIVLEDCNGDLITCTVVVPLVAPDLGDCNLDGVTNAGDAAEILSYSADLGSGSALGLTGAHQMVYDYNCDGVIDASDASEVLIHSAELGAN